MTVPDTSDTLTNNREILHAIWQVSAVAPNPILMVDQAERVLLWNAAAESSFGYRAADFDTLSVWFHRCFPDSSLRTIVQTRWRDAVENASGHGICESLGEHPLCCQRGDFAPVEIFLTVFAHATLVYLHDLTEHNRAIEALRESEERLVAAFAALPDALTISSMKTSRYVLVNDGFVRMFGYARSAVIGKTLTELGLLADEEANARIVEELTRTGEVRDFETTFRRHDQHTLVGRISGRLISASGEGYLLTITRDITRQRELEQQIQQAQRLESVGRLAGGVAHDFNNLLTCIVGNIEHVLDGLPPDAAVRDDLIATLDASERAAGVTRQLLAFGRRQVISPESLSLNVIVANLSKLLERLLGEDIEILERLASDLYRIHADALQVEQVIINLAVNARDAMPQGGRLTIETENVVLDEEYARRCVGARAGWHVRLRVSDNGVGMNDEIQAHIFEPFFTTKEIGKGTGLGLATVYGIVAQSGGHIHVRSQAGSGTTFDVYFPRDETQAYALTQPPPSMRPSDGTETILVVEDDRQVRSILRRVLVRSGYQVLLAENGADALAQWRDHPGRIHLVITDVVMPKMSGKELVNQLAKLCGELRVLYMSGFTDDALGNHGVLEPGTPFLAKPFTAEQLQRKVRHVLDGRGRAHSS